VPGLMRRSRAAEVLDVSERTIRRWGAAGLLEERHLAAHSMRVTADSVRALIAETEGQQDKDDAVTAGSG